MPVCVSRNGEIIPPSQVLKFDSVIYLPEKIATLYDECRKCFTNECYYSTVLLARTLLMYIATDKGAPENRHFAFYIDFLEQNHYITTHTKPWVDKLRTLGNHYVHDITDATKEEASKAAMFSQRLLQTVYELPQMAMEA
jgi:hypothetical protein